MTTERDIERALVDMVKRNDGLCLKWVCPGWSGVPDRIILLPGGRVIFAETKRPKGGRVGPLQDWWRKQLMRLGFQHLYITTRTEVDMLNQLIKEL